MTFNSRSRLSGPTAFISTAGTRQRCTSLRRKKTRAAAIDFVGGREDLNAQLVRAIGDPAQRFAEDRLRLLRAVRFATVLDFEIEAATWEAVVRAADTIGGISAERIREELVRIFLSSQRARGWD